jgi:hypothetical protein
VSLHFDARVLKTSRILLFSHGIVFKLPSRPIVNYHNEVMNIICWIILPLLLLLSIGLLNYYT